MKLELKHLSPYLPYKLKVIASEFSEVNIDETKEDIVTTIMDFTHLENYFWHDDVTLKPLLRPLSDLTKEIYHHILESQADVDYIEHFWLPMDKDSQLTTKFSLDFWEALFENHFDVYGLIPEGLAIDINTTE